MTKYFNDVGLCIPRRHYMVDTTQKIEKIMRLVEAGHYFTINRPRQFGKTTTLALLAKQLNAREDYIALNISFEGIDSDTYQQQSSFIYELLMLLAQQLDQLKFSTLSQLIQQESQQITLISTLSRFITKLMQAMPTKVWVLLIDEVDKSSNNQLFLDFLAMLRNKYLQRDETPTTFQSVILAGVHDIKTLKAKIRPEAEQKYNSPWNIAIDFEVDLSFSATEIETMLQDYSQEHNIQPDITAIAQRLHYYTSGYPYLVSKLCKFIDEKIVSERADKTWHVDDVEAAFKMITNDAYTTTLFDSLIKNLENNEELYDLVFQVVMNGQPINFIIADPVVNFAHLYGIFTPSPTGHCQVHNRIFEQRIAAYMLSKSLRQHKYREINGLGGPDFYTAAGLDIKLVLQRFQAFMQEHASQREAQFLEREGRLLFLSYLQPIVNGKGFIFKEPSVSDERRMDIVITYKHQRHVIELKVWRGPTYHQAGLQQLSDYLDIYGLTEGYLLIYDFNKNKRYKEEELTFQGKQIFVAWV